jgi:gliding motility-associated-like protein
VEVPKIINVRGLPVADFVAPPFVCMPNGKVQFENNSTIQDESVTSLQYEWNFGDNTPRSNTAEPLHTYTTTLPAGFANIYLIAKSQYGCVSDTAFQRVNFFDKPVADFIVSRDTVCQGSSLRFTDQSVAPNSSIKRYSYQFGNGTDSSNAKDVTYRFTNPGDQAVRLIIETQEGCRDTSDLKKIRVNIQPTVDAGKSFTVPVGQPVTFDPKINASGLTYVWTPSTGLSNANTLKPTVKPLTNQTYKLTVTAPGGCSASDSLVVNVMRPITVPNAFSPNGDGINDVWDLRNLADYPSSTVEVFNRYGQSVFLSLGRYTKSWNGSFKGSILPAGTYYYVIDLKNGTAPLSGSISIVK